jgi:hypothetical protein
MTTTALYAALLALLCCALSVRVVRLRLQLKTPLGDGGHPRLQRAIRAHANFVEYVPLGVLVLLLLELQGSAPWVLHGGGALLLLSRLLHAYGLSQTRERLAWRLAGMAGTFTVLGGGALVLLLLGLPAWMPAAPFAWAPSR